MAAAGGARRRHCVCVTSPPFSHKCCVCVIRQGGALWCAAVKVARGNTAKSRFNNTSGSFVFAQKKLHPHQVVQKSCPKYQHCVLARTKKKGQRRCQSVPPRASLKRLHLACARVAAAAAPKKQHIPSRALPKQKKIIHHHGNSALDRLPAASALSRSPLTHTPLYAYGGAPAPPPAPPAPPADPT